MSPGPTIEFPFEPSNEFIISKYTHTNPSHSNTPTPLNTAITYTPNTSIANTPTTPYHTAPNTPESAVQSIATGSPNTDFGVATTTTPSLTTTLTIRSTIQSAIKKAEFTLNAL